MKEEPQFVIIGSGERKRSMNISIVKQLIKKGLTFDDIWKLACHYITARTFNEYYVIAFEQLQEENKNG